MNGFIKVLAWFVGVVSAFVLFAEPTAEVFPAQIMAGTVICGIFFAIRKKEQGVAHA